MQQKAAVDLFRAYTDAQNTMGEQQQGVFRAAELGQDAQELRVKTLLDQARLTHLW